VEPVGSEIDIAYHSLDVEILKSPVSSVMPDAPGRIRCTCTMDLRSIAPQPVGRARFITSPVSPATASSIVASVSELTATRR